MADALYEPLQARGPRGQLGTPAAVHSSSLADEGLRGHGHTGRGRVGRRSVERQCGVSRPREPPRGCAGSVAKTRGQDVAPRGPAGAGAAIAIRGSHRVVEAAPTAQGTSRGHVIAKLSKWRVLDPRLVTWSNLAALECGQGLPNCAFPTPRVLTLLWPGHHPAQERVPVLDQLNGVHQNGKLVRAVLLVGIDQLRNGWGGRLRVFASMRVPTWVALAAGASITRALPAGGHPCDAALT